MPKLILLIAVLMLAGCASFNPPSTIKYPPIPASLIIPCPQPPYPASNAVDDVIEAYIETVGLYHECAAKVADVVKAEKLRE